MVTGAGGFIGSHLVERLVQEGAQVTAFVRYNSRGDFGALKLLPEAEQAAVRVVAGDLCDPRAVAGAVSGQQIVFHLGALIAIPYSYVHPDEVVHTNVIGTVNVLNAARAAGVERFVHTSTSEVYGTAEYAPIDERHRLQGQSPYSASKIGADKIVESYYRSFDVPAVTVRPFNTFGPRQSARAVIPTIIAQALAGGEIRLGSLTPTRDFTFVTDTIEGFLAAAIRTEAIGREINLGTGQEIAIGVLAERIKVLVGSRGPVLTEAGRRRPENSEVTRLVSDNTVARELLGWRPAVPLDEGLRRTIDWMAGHTHLFAVGAYQI
jgi:dTDP-glucose 4,6-dehydratase